MRFIGMVLSRKSFKSILVVAFIILLSVSVSCTVPKPKCGDGICAQAEKQSCVEDCKQVQPPEPKPVVPKESNEIIIGIEYVISGIASGYKDIGIPAVKPLPESMPWCKMQKNPNGPIDFTLTDNYVKEYQDAGFTTLVFGLRTGIPKCLSFWGVKDILNNHAVPKEYQPQYQNWVRSLVERYDKDGIDDMPGLLYPVRHYEISVEFSSFTPEPTEEYLETLALAYKAAHEASDDVVIGHSAFLVTPVFKDNPGPGEYEKAFAENLVGTKGKTLSDIRKVLDRPDLFDVLNVHNLGWPYEIEDIVKWLDYETGKRGYTKPTIISDTVPTSFAGLGPATKCTGQKLAVLFPPATEADRCRVADYFNNLIAKDPETISWLRYYLAADTVQRVVIAADQKIELIDTAFTGDIPAGTLSLFQAAAGNSAWGGMVDIEYSFVSKPKVTGKRAAFYALRQLQEKIKGYSTLSRVKSQDGLRLYKVEKGSNTFYVAWYGYQKLYLPNDPMPTKAFSINIGKDKVTVEQMKKSDEVVKSEEKTENGILEIALTPEPVYIY